MRYVVLAPFYNPDGSMEFATMELLSGNPALQVRTAQLLKGFNAEVKISAAAIKAEPVS